MNYQRIARPNRPILPVNRLEDAENARRPTIFMIQAGCWTLPGMQAAGRPAADPKSKKLLIPNPRSFHGA
ncbi:MAG: hypothetical protein CBB71_02815 [Rhodopirellula sp. TMED11]|nr:MAG: hypothetical protein CBB71_02815 [Rhodopirellula sp. TMED11]